MNININIINEIKQKFENINLNIFSDFCKFLYEYRALRKKISLKNLNKTDIIIKETENSSKNIINENQNLLKNKIKALRLKDSTKILNIDKTDEIKHNRSDILLSDLNGNISKQSLYNKIICNIDLENNDMKKDEIEESIFKISKFRPPKK